MPSGACARDLGADPLELAADPEQALAVFVGGQVGRVRVAERADHAPDRALDDERPIDLAAGVAVVDRVVGVPERLERLGLRRAACRARRRPGGPASSPTGRAPSRPGPRPARSRSARNGIGAAAGGRRPAYAGRRAGTGRSGSEHDGCRVRLERIDAIHPAVTASRRRQMYCEAAAPSVGPLGRG